jgi:hypothetical protein
MNDTVMAFLAVVFVVTVILLLIDYKRSTIKRLADQERRLNYHDGMFSRVDESLRCLTAEIDYHLHDGVSDTMCDAAREWRDGDISDAYVSRSRLTKTLIGGTSLSGFPCRYCKMPINGGDLTCGHCGAMVVDRDVVRLWGGK